jgi:hypothetical protein
MTSFWESKYLSAEKSIEFLQIQHTQTLYSLHETIESLQKQCSGKFNSRTNNIIFMFVFISLFLRFIIQNVSSSSNFSGKRYKKRKP